MSSKRGSMMLPSDFLLSDSIYAIDEDMSNVDYFNAKSPVAANTSAINLVTQTPEAGPSTVEDVTGMTNHPTNSGEDYNQSSIGEGARADSRYYSIVSDATSVRTFFTTRSRETAYSRDSRASSASTRTPWRQTLFERQLLPRKFDETNWSGRGQHVEFQPDEKPVIDKLLSHQGVLGHSATALVDKVRCRRITLARKSIQCSYRVKHEEMIEEVAHLQHLSHAHIIRAVGTYVFKKELSILLYPATAYNLESFMEEYSGQQDDMELLPEGIWSRNHKMHALCQFFKCLASAVAFVHGKLIKHMDIKPTNILIEQRAVGLSPPKLRPVNIQYKVYLADFGIARAYNTAAEVETDSLTAFTKFYAAPEVVQQDKRGFPADIFSLGCVFLDMMTFLLHTREKLLAVRKQTRDYDTLYWVTLEFIPEVEPILGGSGYLFERVHFLTVRSMMSFVAAGPEPFRISEESDFGDVTLLKHPSAVLEDDAA